MDVDKKDFNYSMEKYLDPNRPFKCEVCKESFTQKNILLVHYNSVSHLHRLKKTMQKQQEADKQEIEKQQAQAEKTPPKGSALEALFGRKDDDEVKPYKCNICKVAYSQGSTLDIHIRSVLHQTKASKLGELLSSGEIDMTTPLIENPDNSQQEQKKAMGDMLSPKSVNSTGSTNCNSSPNVRSSSPNRSSSSPQSSPIANLHALMSGKTNVSPNDSSSEAPENTMMANLAKAFLPGLANDDKEAGKPSPVLKNLLQNCGFDMMKHFSDLQQQKRNEVDDIAAPEEDRASERSQSRPSSQAAPQQSMSDVQEAIQKAMLFQQMNPMLMQMNPLLAMNLTPPVMPPALMKPGGPMPDLQAALLAQMHQNTQNMAHGNQPPLMPPMGLDPKLLALMAANKQGDGKVPDLPNLSSLISMAGGNPPSPMDQRASPAELPKLSPFPAGAPKAPSLPDPKALLMQQQPVQVDQGKRARTRITDDQLKILRSNFDINNSPTEESLNIMAGQTGLPLKVIKHWFRNTLFKERQKNKDSPYNFNNAPTTKLNLEEYEKTGEAKVAPLKPEDQAEYVRESIKKEEVKQEKDLASSLTLPPSSLGSTPLPRPPSSGNHSEDSNANATNKVPILNNESSSENSLTLSRLLSSQLSQLPPSNLLPNFPAFPSASSTPLPPTSVSMPDYLSNLANRLSTGSAGGDKPRPQSPQSISSISSGKRANRTRFTDYQIKVLQEFFENNAYPKDDDLEYLSKLLGLSPRVIVVWFQNARQKARKIYENQPPGEGTNGGNATVVSGGASLTGSANGNGEPTPEELENGRFTKTQGCNYQCKKCLLVFQRYYELIRHQKQHCYKEEDAKRSALAQKAAAQAAAQFSGGNVPMPTAPSEDSNSSADHRSITSPFPMADLSKADEAKKELSEMTKDAVNRMFAGGANPLLNSPFALLQQQALQKQQQQQVDGENGEPDELLDNDSLASSPSSKRKLSEDGDNDEEATLKRLRTSILPEQLDFLFKKYQLDSNPSRKMLEQIANEVGLRKRVVQVWFQNTRARERKGTLKAPGPDQGMSLAVPANGESDDEREAPPRALLAGSPFADQFASLLPGSMNLQSSMKKYYEDTMKRFMNDINDANLKSGQAAAGPHAPPPPSGQPPLNSGAAANNNEALDLTSNFDDSSDHQEDYPLNNSMETDSANGGAGSSKRFRTQMSGVQVKMMKGVFEVYKTPTMTECSNLGAKIGLQKRVVQVWFQNARAKEKRAKLQLQQATGQEPEGPPAPESCKVCNFDYGHKFAVQDHLFTQEHLDQLRAAIESGRYDPESPGHAMAQTAAMIQSGGGNGSGHRTPSGDSPNPSLSMLQMSAPVNNRELLDPMANHGTGNPRMMMQV